MARQHVHHWVADTALSLNNPLDELAKKQPKLSDEVKEYLEFRIASSCQTFNDDFARHDRSFAVGGTFSIADCYLYEMIKRAESEAGIKIDSYPELKKYCASIAARKDVKAAELRMAANPNTTMDKTAGTCLGICPWMPSGLMA